MRKGRIFSAMNRKKSDHEKQVQIAPMRPPEAYIVIFCSKEQDPKIWALFLDVVRLDQVIVAIFSRTLKIARRRANLTRRGTIEKSQGFYKDGTGCTSSS